MHLLDILRCGSDRSAQKVSAADRRTRVAVTAQYSCQRELLEECMLLRLQSVTMSRK